MTAQSNLNDLTAAMEAAGIYVAVSVRDGALVLEGEVDNEEMRQAALDLAGAVAERAGLTVEDAIEVLEIDLELGSPDHADVDVTTLTPMDANTLTDVGTVDPTLAMEEAIPYFPPTDPVIGEQLVEQDEVEVIGGFQPTSDDGDEDSVSANRLNDDERISDDVRQELKQDATTTDLGGIFVSTVGGVVHLHGNVPTLEDADNAEAVAARVPGVQEVREELQVLTMKAD
jgi:osmotically-inducible protein OsmY